MQSKTLRQHASAQSCHCRTFGAESRPLKRPLETGPRPRDSEYRHPLCFGPSLLSRQQSCVLSSGRDVTQSTFPSRMAISRTTSDHEVYDLFPNWCPSHRLECARYCPRFTDGLSVARRICIFVACRSCASKSFKAVRAACP